MKQLLLIRHAKAEVETNGVKDVERVLTSEGVRSALKTGVLINEKGLTIQQLITSSSIRTLMTSEYLAERLPLDENKVIIREELYLASLRIWLQEINQLDDAMNCVLMVGHNPEISYLIEYLTKENVDPIPPSGSVMISFELDTWMAISEGLGKINWTINLDEQ